MERVLEQGRQLILFQNRRGYVPYQICSQCGWIPACRHCDVSLTLHKKKQQLLCHYCGSAYGVVTRCTDCGGQSFTQRNFGTELIEEELQRLFPSARIARMDIDAIRGKQAHEQLVRMFEQGQIDILVGTQMVVKGLDVDRVDLVGVVDADGLLHFTDFRVHERAFQLLEQVSGRAGRKEQTATVLVQTSQPAHPVLAFVTAHDYRAFFDEEISKREEFFYPPFSRLIVLSFRHRDQPVSARAAQTFANAFKKSYGSYMVGPAPAVVARVRNQYRTELLLKLPRRATLLSQCKADIKQLIVQLTVKQSFSNCASGSRRRYAIKNMDSLTHIALGACVGAVLAARPLGRKALLWGAVAQSIPDIDFLAGLWCDPAEDLLAHRGFTHSFLCVVPLAPLLALGAARWHFRSDYSTRKWILFFGLQMLIHLLIDALNVYGTGWGEPFTHARVSGNLLFVADRLFTLPLLVAAVFLFFRCKNSDPV
jgi:membrane-bound metal-dependent hydrolase YbcI (DUF457 family)